MRDLRSASDGITGPNHSRKELQNEHAMRVLDSRDAASFRHGMAVEDMFSCIVRSWTNRCDS